MWAELLPTWVKQADIELRTELVCDALDMACWRRKPPSGQVILHADHGSQYTFWAFGQRLRAAGLLRSMGTVDDALDDAMAERFFATLQLKHLDPHRWATRRELAQAIFEYIEVFYNPESRHSSIGNSHPSPTRTTTPPRWRWYEHHTKTVRETGGRSCGRSHAFAAVRRSSGNP